MKISDINLKHLFFLLLFLLSLHLYIEFEILIIEDLSIDIQVDWSLKQVLIVMERILNLLDIVEHHADKATLDLLIILFELMG